MADAFERERFAGADLALDREAPDRPAGRLVAVVTVGNRVVPLRRRYGDTAGAGPSDGDDHRHDHGPLAGPVADQAAQGLAGHPVEGLVVVAP